MTTGIFIQCGLQKGQQIESGVSRARDGSIRPAAEHSIMKQ